MPTENDDNRHCQGLTQLISSNDIFYFLDLPNHFKTQIAMTHATSSISGYLFARLENLGSKSEGPVYYLQTERDGDVRINKKTHSWEVDPALHAHLGERVRLFGALKNDAFDYERITDLDLRERSLQLELLLGLKDKTLWIHKKASALPVRFPPEMREMELTLAVRWPFESVWKGQAPTSQLFDFWIEGPEGKECWRWSRCVQFLEEPTRVEVWGGQAVRVSVRWAFFEEAIRRSGEYIAHARFLPTGQEVCRRFEVRMADIMENA